ncbi:hypothetical protein TNCV_523071 [Trichonephila clavipes]|nr:hypothetical protein TNCV_523071 [Trichonephila clavipes]
MGEIGNVIEEFTARDLGRQINLEVDSGDFQELLNSRNQDLTMDELIEMQEQEQDIEKLEVRIPDEIFFPLQLLQLEEATSSTTPYRDHHRGGPLRLPGGQKDALRDSQKRNNECLNGK